MCILIVKPAGVKLPPQQVLKRCAHRNPHGCGFATADKCFKSLSLSAFTRELSKVDPSEAMIIHFRYATHGSVNRSNCHPFKDEQIGVAFAHNGVLPIIPYQDKTDSETAFIRLFKPIIAKCGLYSAELRDMVDAVIGGSKFAFIDENGNIKTFGRFIDVNGVYYSNLNF